MKINISESVDQTAQQVGEKINSLILSMSVFSSEYHILGEYTLLFIYLWQGVMQICQSMFN